ncbi:UNVERIFIED_CONTAM: histidine-containing phosphotransfer protein 6 [Sesamum calycinum]|uniref:Histidine-containing phosphotransfer protein n=1 Tax=Sesamum calycinum TaxID=2727403 RepID=A0AAW2NGQ4_9LAMI
MRCVASCAQVVLHKVRYTCQIPIGRNHPPAPFKFLPTRPPSLSSLSNSSHRPSTRTQTQSQHFLKPPTFSQNYPRICRPTCKVRIFSPFCYLGRISLFAYRVLEEIRQNGSSCVDVGAQRGPAAADMNRLLALLFHQGVLDEQFLQLQQLQDESSPNFVSEVVNIYFHESEKLLRNLRALLVDKEFSDYKKMGVHLNQFMGSSSSIGAKRVRNVCVAFRAASDQNNRAGCLRALELLEYEYCYLKSKLHELFQIEQQRILAAAVRYPVQHHHHHQQQPNNP